MSQQTFKACPHCQGSQVQACSSRNGGHYVVCLACGARGPLCAAKDTAVTSWNRRDSHARALHAAVEAIYFADSSDYLSALWGVVRALAPELVDELESQPRKVWSESSAVVDALDVKEASLRLEAP